MQNLFDWFVDNPVLMLLLVTLISAIGVKLLKTLISRAAFFIVIRTKNVYDDLIVDCLMPFRFIWLLPLILILVFSNDLFPTWEDSISLVMNTLIVWASLDLVLSLLDGANDIHRNSPKYRGDSIAGYLGLIKVLLIMVALVLSISLLFDMDVATIMGSFGAWLAVLLLIFRDTIMSFMASLQINSQQLIKEGDWIEAPAYSASGIVSEMSLQNITITNFDKTTTIIPTHKMTDIAYRNFRGLLAIGVRRMKKTLRFDNDTIGFVNQKFLDDLKKNDIVVNSVNERIQSLKEFPKITNLEIYMNFVEQYLRARKDVMKGSYTLVIRVVDIEATGTEIELIIFVKAKDWETYERKHTEIMLHLLSISSLFNLELPNLNVKAITVK